MVEITEVWPDTCAARAGLAAGDVLLTVNGHEIRDVLDYRFYMTDCDITLGFRRDGTDRTVQFRKGEYEDIGLGFERPLMDKKHACENKCVFCFIDQLPRGMRKTLYFKDDDSRLSFLHGNYITLTNLQERDIDRIITMHIAPVNISVHTTNPDLRCAMMHNPRAGEVLSYLTKLAEAGIALCTQIVLCRGLNDGAELDRTMRDLTSLVPALQSCSIVPAGLTKFRENLYPLSPYSPAECGQILDQVEAFAAECRQRYGTRLFFCADELYIKAGRPLPDEDDYEGYPQLENGVGMVTSLRTEFEAALQDLTDEKETFALRFPAGRTVSLATGAAAYDSICAMTQHLMQAVPGLTVHVYRIINHFFGESITVSGLLTGTDMAEQLAGRALGDELLIPANTLKADEDVFLDDMTPAMLSEALGVKVTPSAADGDAFVRALLGL